VKLLRFVSLVGITPVQQFMTAKDQHQSYQGGFLDIFLGKNAGTGKNLYVCVCGRKYGNLLGGLGKNAGTGKNLYVCVGKNAGTGKNLYVCVCGRKYGNLLGGLVVAG
jgi:hypothetical protein